MILRRCVHAPTGIFGVLEEDDGKRLCYTLEHAYQQPNEPWMPKLPKGTYVCQFGYHRLSNGPFATFEITNVPGHSGILFHTGNYNDDSEGCVLLGTGIDNDMLVESKEAFDKFMSRLSGISTFNLTVS
jgi:hypothetical protein